MPLLLLPYATTTQALSATTAQVIHGTQPYLTFDNGVTKVTTTEGLLGITISDGTTQTTYTPDNTSTPANPIVLPVANQRFTDIGILVPTNTNSIALSALIGAPYNYWGDDDGDGQGANGITATGNLSVSITDKDNQVVSRSASLDICKAPYKVALTSTAGSLTTQYGLPNSSSFSGSTATYYISPKAVPTICYARPTLRFGTNGQERLGFNYAGPATIWSPTKGFLVQSTTPSGYSRNFPTTGANNLYFDLDIGGIKGSALTWTTVSQGGITATMTPSPDNANNIRVTLTGPLRFSNITLPQTFVLVGKDSSNNEVLSYGFVLKQWYINRGNLKYTVSAQSSWCSNLGGHLPRVKDLTTAVCPGTNGAACRGSVGARPPSDGNYYQRNIGAGFFTEWGFMPSYTDAGFVSGPYFTSDSRDIAAYFVVYSNNGTIYAADLTGSDWALCTYP